MAYNEEIDSRIKKIVGQWGHIGRKKMFGGTCFLVLGKMFCGVYRDSLILRLGEKGAAEALRARHVKPFDITGRPMKGWVMVGREGFATDEELAAWLEEAKDFAETL